MNEPEANSPEMQSSSLLKSVQRLFTTLLEMTFTRFELFLMEFEDALAGLVSQLLWAFVALLAAGAALFIGALALIFAFWDTHRILVSVLVMIGFLTLAAFAALQVLAKRRLKRNYFAATLNQFAKDRELLKVRP